MLAVRVCLQNDNKEKRSVTSHAVCCVCRMISIIYFTKTKKELLMQKAIDYAEDNYCVVARRVLCLDFIHRCFVFIFERE